MSIDQRLGRGLIGHSLQSVEREIDRQLVAQPVDALLATELQFVPAKVPYSWRSAMFKTKYSNFSTVRSPTVVSRPMDCLEDKAKHSPSSGCDGLPTPQFEIFPSDEICLTWNSENRCGTGVGLQNLGNTCFLNSILQVLVNTPPIVNYLSTNKHAQQHCPQVTGFCAICSLKLHVQRVFVAARSRDELVSPNYIVQKIRCMMKNHSWGSQEDAHEFLRYFVDAMQTAALHPYKDKELDMFTKETTVVSRIFGGFHRSQIICNNCQFVSVTYDAFLDLSLEIKQWNSVESALAHYTRMETLSNENAYLCPRCKKRVSAKKILTIHTPPNVLTVHLKRFDHVGKIDRHIAYSERLNLRPYMTEKQGMAINYRLYAVVVHNGRSTHSGHYYAYVRNPLGQWHQMDDSRVLAVSNESPLKVSAYLLFYLRMPSPMTAAVKPQAKVEEDKEMVETVWESKNANNGSIDNDHNYKLSQKSNNDAAIADRRKISFKFGDDNCRGENNSNRSVKLSRITPFKIKLQGSSATRKQNDLWTSNASYECDSSSSDEAGACKANSNGDSSRSPVAEAPNNNSNELLLPSTSSSSASSLSPPPLEVANCQPVAIATTSGSENHSNRNHWLCANASEKAADPRSSTRGGPDDGKSRKRIHDDVAVSSISKCKRSPSIEATDKRRNSSTHRSSRDLRNAGKSKPKVRCFKHDRRSHRHHRHSSHFRRKPLRLHSSSTFNGISYRKNGDHAYSVYRKPRAQNNDGASNYGSMSFGSSVKSWTGEMNSIDRGIVAQQLMERNRRRDSDDEYDEYLRFKKADRSRRMAKRVRNGESNGFQRVQDRRNGSSNF